MAASLQDEIRKRDAATLQPIIVRQIRRANGERLEIQERLDQQRIELAKIECALKTQRTFVDTILNAALRLGVDLSELREELADLWPLDKATDSESNAGSGAPPPVGKMLFGRPIVEAASPLLPGLKDGDISFGKLEDVVPSGEPVYEYLFQVWPAQNGTMLPAMFLLFTDMPRMERELTESQFGEFVKQLAHHGLTLREVERRRLVALETVGSP